MKFYDYFSIGEEDSKLCVIAGPCQIENQEHANMMCKKLMDICNDVGVNFVYKSSFDKANRTSWESKRGVGMIKGVEILKHLQYAYGIPILTDVHEVDQVKYLALHIDIIQIPAFLSRQTDLLVEVGEYFRYVNIKKAQFTAPSDIIHAVEKITTQKNKIRATQKAKIMITERGTCFGHNDLVVDMRGFPIMKEFGYPVIFDGTHSVQQPGGSTTKGNREMVPYLTRAALATGCVDGVFLEVHQDPDNAPSDGPNMIRLSEFEIQIREYKAIYDLTKNYK